MFLRYAVQIDHRAARDPNCLHLRTVRRFRSARAALAFAERIASRMPAIPSHARQPYIYTVRDMRTHAVLACHDCPFPRVTVGDLGYY